MLSSTSTRANEDLDKLSQQSIEGSQYSKQSFTPYFPSKKKKPSSPVLKSYEHQKNTGFEFIPDRPTQQSRIAPSRCPKQITFEEITEEVEEVELRALDSTEQSGEGAKIAFFASHA